jgi:predicted esterase
MEPNVEFKSLLAWREWRGDVSAGSTAVIALHGYGSRMEQLVPLTQAAFPRATVFTPNAPREVHPYTHEPSIEDKGGYWYVMDVGNVADTLRFLDSVWRLEQFVLDVVRYRGSDAGPLFVMGRDQGADMAIALAMVMPEYLSGIVSIGGGIQNVANWTAPEIDMGQMPILLIGTPGENATFTARDLTRRGSVVRTVAVEALGSDLLGWAPRISSWLAE